MIHCEHWREGGCYSCNRLEVIKNEEQGKKREREEVKVIVWYHGVAYDHEFSSNPQAGHIRLLKRSRLGVKYLNEVFFISTSKSCEFSFLQESEDGCITTWTKINDGNILNFITRGMLELHAKVI